jgi:hypothetical protein
LAPEQEVKLLYRTLAAVAVSAAILIPTVAQSAPDVSDKVVLANLDRYPAQLKLGNTRREVAPKKASVLKPKKYPVTVEFWSGNTKNGWKKLSIAKAGMYGMNFKKGVWTVAELKRGKSTAKAPSPATVEKSRATRAKAVPNPVRRGPINADRSRWHPLARAAWFTGSVYNFVRDEQDRSAVRRLIRDGRNADWKDAKDWLKGYDKIGDGPKAELYSAMDELSTLSGADWKEIETADEKDWGQAKTDLGDLVSKDEWNDFAEDFDDIDTADFWKEDVDVDDVELDDLDLEDDIDLGDDIDLAEEFDVDDLDIDDENYDLDDYDDFDGFDGDDGGDLGDDFDDDDFGDDDFGDFDDDFDDFDF